GATGNTLTNAGVLAPGASGLAVTTQLSGSFRQLQSGSSNLELDFLANAVDSVNATGTVNLAGNINVNLLNTQAIRPGVHTKALYQGAGGMLANSPWLQGQRSVVIKYDLVFPDARTAALRYDVNFAAHGLQGNRLEIGDYINRVQEAGSSLALADSI